MKIGDKVRALTDGEYSKGRVVPGEVYEVTQVVDGGCLIAVTDFSEGLCMYDEELEEIQDESQD